MHVANCTAKENQSELKIALFKKQGRIWALEVITAENIFACYNLWIRIAFALCVTDAVHLYFHPADELFTIAFCRQPFLGGRAN